MLAAASAPLFIDLSLMGECRDWCSRAIRILDDRQVGTTVEVELQAALGLSLMFTRGTGEEVEAALQRGLTVATELGDRWNQLRLLGRLHIFYGQIGNFGAAHARATAAMDVAAAIGQDDAIAVAASMSGVSHHLAGDQVPARRALDLSTRHSPSPARARARASYYGVDHRNRSRIALTRALWLQGFADQARRLADATIDEATELENPATHCIALTGALSLHYWVGDIHAMESAVTALSDCAETNAFGPYMAVELGFRGKLAILQGRPDGAAGMLTASLARLHAAGNGLLTSMFEMALVHALAQCERCPEALSLANASMERCEASGERLPIPEMLQLKSGIIQSMKGDAADEAEALLLRSIALSREQGARAWELRSAIDLGSRWLAEERRNEARALLEPLYASFSEGFDTADLRAGDLLLKRMVDG